MRKYLGKRRRYNVFQRQNWKCAICLKKIAYNKSTSSQFRLEIGEIDHIIPVSDFENANSETYEDYISEQELCNNYDNLQALCKTCNRKKSDKPAFSNFMFRSKWELLEMWYKEEPQAFYTENIVLFKGKPLLINTLTKEQKNRYGLNET